MNTKEFFEKAQNDEELLKKFAGINKPEKFYEIASENGLTDDFETMKQIVADMAKADDKISGEDLKRLNEVAGGDYEFDVSEGVTAGSLVMTFGVILYAAL